MSPPRSRALAAFLALLACAAATPAGASDPAPWTAAQRATIRSLSIDALPPAPESPGNPVADEPRAVSLGHRLFFDTRLSATGTVACATCHRPELGFQDGLRRGRAIGETRRRTMSLVGAAWSPWLFWDGRRDSLWAQALEPLEDRAEHGGTRLQYYRLVVDGSTGYRDAWETVFGPLEPAAALEELPRAASPRGTPDERAAWAALPPAERDRVSATFANIGRALEAYQRTLVPAATPFDRFARALDAGDADAARAAMTGPQRAGLRLFIGRANCVHCHNGPLFTNNEFHATGLGAPDRLPEDRGRVDGVKLALADEFNCLGAMSGAERSGCGELAFVKDHGIELVAAFRTPSLRGTASRGPYMHTGEHATLREVLEHYDAARPTLISDELEPLGLSEKDFAALEAFLHALDGPLATPERLLAPPPSAGP